jgi:hypothetical protein
VNLYTLCLWELLKFWNNNSMMTRTSTKNYYTWWPYRRFNLYLAIITKTWINFTAINMKIIMTLHVIWSNQKVPLSWTLHIGFNKCDFINFMYE